MPAPRAGEGGKGLQRCFGFGPALLRELRGGAALSAPPRPGLGFGQWQRAGGTAVAGLGTPGGGSAGDPAAAWSLLPSGLTPASQWEP